MSKLLLKVDASLYDRASCRRYINLRAVQGYSPAKQSYKMEFGTAGHKAIAHHYLTHNTKDAIEIALEHYKDVYVPPYDYRTEHYLRFVLEGYFASAHHRRFKPYSINSQELAVELAFNIPLYVDDYVEILLAGTIDFFGEVTINNQAYNMLVDNKFTGATSPKLYFSGYDLSPQLMTYTMVLTKLFPEKSQGMQAVINGIFLRKNAIPVLEISDPIPFSQEKLDLMWRQYQQQAKVISYCVQTGEWLPNYSQCRKIGVCDFCDVCRLDEEMWPSKLALDYEQKEYDPIKFQE